MIPFHFDEVFIQGHIECMALCILARLKQETTMEVSAVLHYFL